jgi:hypothetical protein
MPFYCAVKRHIGLMSPNDSKINVRSGVASRASDSAMDGRGQTNGVDSEQSEDDSGGALDAEKW